MKQSTVEAHAVMWLHVLIRMHRTAQQDMHAAAIGVIKYFVTSTLNPSQSVRQLLQYKL
jgi:hypothetical protein